MAVPPEKSAALHQNHRQRLKARFKHEGLDHFEDHNVLELLLFYSIPRCDTNEIAHILLEEFGSIPNVFNASFEALAGTPGIGPESALFLKLIASVSRRYLTDSEKVGNAVRCGSDAVGILSPYFLVMDQERLVCLLLDHGGHVMRKLVIAQGNENTVSANLEKIVKEAVLSGAGNVIIAHSHPSGFAAPSQQDLDATQALSRTLRALHINLCEHVIFARNGYYLMSTYGFEDPKTLIFHQISQ